jgi:streptogramin lyase
MHTNERRPTSLTPGRRASLLIAVLLAGCSSPVGVAPTAPVRLSPPPTTTPSITVPTATPDVLAGLTPVTPAAVIEMPGASGVIATVTDGTTLWAVENGAILRIDVATNRVERLPAPVQSDDTSMAIADDGLWVSRWSGGRLYRLDPRTGKVLMSAELPWPVGFAFIGDDLWVGLEHAHQMVLVDRATGKLGRTVDVGAYGREGLGDLWFVPRGSTTIERVDPTSGSIKATIEAKGEENCGLAGEFPDKVWLSCFGRDVRPRTVSRIDPETNTVAAVASLPPSHGGGVVIIDGETWFLGNFEDAGGKPFGGLLHLDGATGAIERFVSIGPADPDSALHAGGAIWIPDEAGHRILRVNLADLAG